MLKVYYTNCNGISNKLAELKTIACNENYDILCLTETHLNPNITDAEIYIDNFTIFRGDRKDNREKGGSIIYVYNNIACSILESFQCNDSLAVLTKLPSYQLAIVCIYRSQSISYTDNLKMIEQIRNLKSLISSGIDVLMVGDLNLPNVLWDSGSVTAPSTTKNRQLLLQKKFINVFQDVGLQWQLKDGTITRRRIYNGTLQESLLDQILISDNNLVLDCSIDAHVGKSDHRAIITKLRCANMPGYSLDEKICWSKVKPENIIDHSRKITWDYRGEGNVEDIWHHIHERICIISKDLPTMKTKILANGTACARPPWESTCLSRRRRAKSKAWATFENHPTNDNLMAALEKDKELQNDTTTAMAKHEAKMTSDRTYNPKSFYRYVNSKRKIKQSVVSVKNSTGHFAQSPKESAEILAEFFESTFQNTGIRDSKSYLAEPQKEEYYIGLDEISKLLSEVNVYKSVGPDQMHGKILKSLSKQYEFVQCIKLLFNTCVSTGKIPVIWKQARVTPIHKKGSKTDAKNYRPISLTSILCKTYEKIIREKIIAEIGSKITSLQHGFVKNKSCLSNLLKAADFINEKLSQNEPVDLFYFDFQKAFDSVPHTKLMTKLENLGLGGQLLAIIADFLSERTFCVTVGNSSSSPRPVLSGVPQGSVLGPILFVLYINDMPDVVKNLLLLFADDAKMCTTAGTHTLNQDDLNRLSQWQNDWDLTFNTVDSKCKVMHIGKSNPKNTYFLNGQQLPSTTEEKDLGVWTTDSYSWQLNIDNSVNKARSTMAWIMRVIINKEKGVMLQLYKSLVRPLLEYCVQLWSPTARHGNWGQIFQLEDVQREFTRQINGYGCLSYKERLEALQLTTLLERRARGDIIETFKIVKGFTNYGQELFRISRNGNNILHPVGKRSTQQNDFLNTRVIEYWNKLHIDVKNSTSVPEFKSRLESFKKSNKASGTGVTNYWTLSDTLLDKINDFNRDAHIAFLDENPEIANYKKINLYRSQA